MLETNCLATQHKTAISFGQGYKVVPPKRYYFYLPCLIRRPKRGYAEKYWGINANNAG